MISTTFCPGLAMTMLLGLQSACHLTAKLRDNKRIREKDRVTRVTWTTRLQNSLVLSVLSFIYFILGQNYSVFLKLPTKYYLFSDNRFSKKKRERERTSYILKAHVASVYPGYIWRHQVATSIMQTIFMYSICSLIGKKFKQTNRK